MRRPIVFITDYGREDAYAAALTGAVWRVDPHAVCVEGTHGVPPGDILAAAYYLKSLALAFDPETVFCAVVDPGVGTDRRAIAVDAGGVLCVAPDNGIVTYIWRESPPQERRAVALETPDWASQTFHGRDVFAPVAAQFAGEIRLDDAGEPIDDPILLPDAFARRDLDGIGGRVAVVDHFGNAITTIRVQDLGVKEIAEVRWATGSTQTVVTTYAEIPGGLAVLFGSAGHLEIAAQGQPAASHAGPGRGDEVVVTFR